MHCRYFKFAAALLLFLLAAAFNPVTAAVRLPAIIGDHMVLQEKMKVPLWGWAEPGEQVSIHFLNKTFTTTTAQDGRWSLRLGSYKAGGPYSMMIDGEDNSITINDILIGEVWVASGQSNMEFGIQTEQHGADAIANAKDTLIHFFFVPFASSLQKQDRIAAVPEGSPNGKWVVCSPRMMANPQWAWHGFSAVGYYFAQRLRGATHAPVGMIAVYKGGTAAQAWTSLEALQKKPAFTRYIDRYQDLVTHYDQAKANYPHDLQTYQEALKKWNDEVGNDFTRATKDWEAAAAAAKASGQPIPTRPKPSRPAPQNPTAPDGGFNSPTNLFNAMLNPVIGYGIKGVIWYQGESNGDRLTDALEYKDIFARMINDWRQRWGEGNFPFLFMQLPNYRMPAQTPSEGNWPWVREGQVKTLGLPNTGMAVIIDLGEADNIHPINKRDPGIRLSQVALNKVYKQNVICSGPVFKSAHIEGNKIRLDFETFGNGLKVGSGIDTLRGFGIAGADQKFVWAKAVIEGNAVMVSADGVSAPVAVRYDWADNPNGNLYNTAGLPASPFRTDNWQPPLKP